MPIENLILSDKEVNFLAVFTAVALYVSLSRLWRGISVTNISLNRLENLHNDIISETAKVKDLVDSAEPLWNIAGLCEHDINYRLEHVNLVYAKCLDIISKLRELSETLDGYLLPGDALPVYNADLLELEAATSNLHKFILDVEWLQFAQALGGWYGLG